MQKRLSRVWMMSVLQTVIPNVRVAGVIQRTPRIHMEPALSPIDIV
jgi:hypothetical protein